MDAAPDPSVPTADPPSASATPSIAICAETPANANPSAMTAELNQAAAALAAGQLRQAFGCVKALLAHSPDHPRALGMLGHIAVAMEQPALGLESLQRAVTLDPRLDHWIWLSLCLAKLDCHEDALSAISAASKTMPPTANAHFAVGMVLHALGRPKAAAASFAKCIKLDAARAPAHYRYARALHAAGRYKSAVAACAEAIRLCPTEAEYHTDFSSVLSDLGRFEEARVAAKTATELDPNCIIGYNNLGHALHNLNRSAEALAVYETAIGMRGTYAKAQFGYAVALLKSGDFARGWRQYEWRWLDCQTFRRDLDVPVWQGEDVAGLTILLHAEQGFGDTLQFVRFASLVASRGARVVLEVPAPLVRLMHCIDGVAKVIACGDPVPPIDFHCPMASLPLTFELRIETIPQTPYFHINLPPAKALTYRNGDEPDLVVGLVWAGDPRPSDLRSNLVDRRRSTTLEGLAPLLDVPGVRFVSFQFGPPRAQIAASNWPVADALKGVIDFADTAERLVKIDLLISVDTAMVHLAGGLGVPVWMLSRYDACWRWMEGRDRSPWYPSMRIFRQPSPGDWSGVVAEAATALRAFVRTHNDRNLCRLDDQ